MATARTMATTAWRAPVVIVLAFRWVPPDLFAPNGSKSRAADDIEPAALTPEMTLCTRATTTCQTEVP